MPLGLIINELVANALKYAFPDNRAGIITIFLSEKDEFLHLTVQDDGIGISDADQEKGFGSGLIQAFANKLDADLKTTVNDGLTISLIIKDYVKS